MKAFLKKVNQSNTLFDILIVMGIFLLAMGLANYLGTEINIPGFILGSVGCVLLLVTIKGMEFYSLRSEQLDFDHELLRKIIPGLSPNHDGKPSNRTEYSGLILLLILIAGWATIQFVLLQTNMLPVSALIWIFLIALFAMLLGMPSINIVNSGFAELIKSMLLFGLFPVYAFLTIGGEFHILIVLICIPIAFFYLALQLSLGLYHYTDDQNSGRKNLLQRIGWKQGMFFHNLFILIGFVSFACTPLFGYPEKIFLNPLIVLPVGLILIFMLYRIEHGRKPEWNSLIFLEKVMHVLVMYFFLAALVLQ